MELLGQMNLHWRHPEEPDSMHHNPPTSKAYAGSVGCLGPDRFFYSHLSLSLSLSLSSEPGKPDYIIIIIQPVNPFCHSFFFLVLSLFILLLFPFYSSPSILLSTNYLSSNPN